MYDYVIRSSTNNSVRVSRPCTPSTPSSRGGSCSNSRAPSALSSQSDAETAMETFAPSLNAYKIDEITDKIRILLEEEKQLLEDDIRIIHDFLYNESSNSMCLDHIDPPRIEELRDLSCKLEDCKEVAVAEVKHVERVTRLETPNEKSSRGRVNQLRNTVAVFRDL